MQEKKKLSKTTIIRSVAFIVFLIVSIGLTILLFPLVKSLLTEEGRLAIQARVESVRPFGWLLFLGLQMLQVIVAMIPGEPIEIIGGVLFGALDGLILCLLGIFLGTIAVYYLVKALGLPLVHAFVSDEKLHSLKLFQNEKRLDILVFLLFFIPGTPKDTLTYLMPLTPIKPMRFFVISTLARIPSVITSTLAGQNLGSGNWIGSVIMFAAAGILGIGGILLQNKLSQKWQKKSSENKKSS